MGKDNQKNNVEKPKESEFNKINERKSFTVPFEPPPGKDKKKDK